MGGRVANMAPGAPVGRSPARFVSNRPAQSLGRVAVLKWAGAQHAISECAETDGRVVSRGVVIEMHL